MAFDDISIEFAVGGVTLEPVPGMDNLLNVKIGDQSSLIGANHLAKIIHDGVFPFTPTGEEILELTPEMEERATAEPKLACSMGRFEIINYKDGSLGIRIAPDYGIESNFEFYIDGWTLKGNSGGETFEAVSPNAGKITIKSSALTAFLERRLTPGENDASITA